jgi:lipoprotein-anchoring transpeptidase ErfK/SrfK
MRLVQLLGLLALCAGLAGGPAAEAHAEMAVRGRGGTDSEATQAAPAGGRWVRISLSQLVAHAMVGQRPVHAAPITAGTPAWPTPTGTFRILRRVASETMDSSTIGIPRFAPGGYYLTGVLHTQYFTPAGHSLHYNYWSPRAAFGRAAGSHGCVGLLDDAAYFWRFATIGTPVVITR